MPVTGPIPLVDPLLGAQVGDYRVEGVIGEGGMGVVYRGVHPVIGKPVAIKVLKASLAKNKGLTERLIEEARAVNAIGHRNIIDIFGLGELPDGRPYIVMEQLAGEPLDAFLQRQRALTEKAAVELILELCAPLEAAHRAGVVHRDLKPANVFLCDQADGGPRFVKLLDFGLARRTAGFGTSTEQTNRAYIIGTPNYLAPEQASGGRVSDRTDVYALGVMLYEFLTGSVPFTGNNAIEVAMAHVNQPAPRVTDLAPQVSAPMADLIARMLAKKAEDRPSVEDVRRILAPNAPPRVAPAPRPSESGRLKRDLTVTMMSPRPAASARKWIAAGAVALLTIAGLGFALQRTSGTDEGRRSADAPGTGTAGTGTAGTGAAGTGAAGTGAAGTGAAGTGTAATGAAGTGAAGAESMRAVGPGMAGAGTNSAGTGAAGTGTAGTGAVGAAPAGTGSAGAVGAGPVAVPVVGSGGSGTGGEGGDDPRTPATNRGPRPRAESKAPTNAELTQRIARLERKLREVTPAGEEPDPSALKLLGSYRLKAELASTPTERLEVSKKLDAWQRAHL